MSVIILQVFKTLSPKQLLLIAHNCQAAYRAGLSYTSIDGSSSDQLLSLARDLQERHPRFTYIRTLRSTEPTKSLYEAALKNTPEHTTHLLLLSPWDEISEDIAELTVKSPAAFLKRDTQRFVDEIISISKVPLLSIKLFQALLANNAHFDFLEDHLYLYLKNQNIKPEILDTQYVKTNHPKEIYTLELAKLYTHKATSLKYLTLKIADTESISEKFYLQFKRFWFKIFSTV
jgi:hypothetical protein